MCPGSIPKSSEVDPPFFSFAPSIKFDLFGDLWAESICPKSNCSFRKYSCFENISDDCVASQLAEKVRGVFQLQQIFDSPGRQMILNFLKKDVKANNVMLKNGSPLIRSLPTYGITFQERLSVESALTSRIIRKTYVTSTEPALARVNQPTRRSVHLARFFLSQKGPFVFS